MSRLREIIDAFTKRRRVKPADPTGSPTQSRSDQSSPQDQPPQDPPIEGETFL